MTNVAVIIPYFQREAGVLRRALTSVLTQKYLSSVHVTLIVVDDGSPVTAESETAGLTVSAPFSLSIFRQENGGVASARNAGLRQTNDKTDYIAFLDSDDTWMPEHLAQALRALSKDNDFYFTDNRRTGHHLSYFNKCCPEILHFATPQLLKEGFAKIESSNMVPLVLEHFPTQASSVVYRRSAFPNHFFPEFQKFAGEDLIFFTGLAASSKRTCFSPEVMVECGQGINMYFNNLQWDSPSFLSIISDQIRALLYMRHTIPFRPRENTLTRFQLAFYRKNFVFHALRRFIKSKGKIPAEARKLASDDKSFVWWFPKYLIYVSVGKILRVYKPTQFGEDDPRYL